MLGHAHPLEYCWVFSAMVFLFVSVRRLIRSVEYHLKAEAIEKYARAKGIERRDHGQTHHLQSEDEVYNELFRFGLGALNQVMSIVCLFLPPPPPAYRDVPQSLAILVLVISSCWVKTLWTVFTEKREKRVFAAVAEERRLAALSQGLPLASESTEAVQDVKESKR